MKNLEVLLGAQQLIVLISGLPFGLKNLLLLRFNDLLKLILLGENKLVVRALRLKLSLKSANGSTRRLTLSLTLKCLHLQFLNFIAELFLLVAQSLELITLIGELCLSFSELLLQLANPRFVKLELFTKLTLVIRKLVINSSM
jgi:hypothetical protein